MPHTWTQPNPLTNEPAWQGDADALLWWARWTVEGLHYLADLDTHIAIPSPPGSHEWYVIDLAHARWASGSAVGAIDLCSAALARRLGMGPKTLKSGAVREYDLGDLVADVKRGAVTPPGAWANAVNTDRNVQLLVAVRHPTTHARLKRHFYRGGGGSERTHLIVEDMGVTIEVGDLVRIARDTATAVVDDFLNQIAAGAL